MSEMFLARDTAVRMADGSAKPIQDIAVGDLVVGASLCAHTRPARVIARQNSGPRECSRYTFRFSFDDSDRRSVMATRGYKVVGFESADNTICAVPLGRATRAVALSPVADAAWAKSDTRAWVKAPLCECSPVTVVETYDLEIDHPEHMFLLADGLIVSDATR